MAGQDETYLDLDSNELLAFDKHDTGQYDELDTCLDEALQQSPDLFSIRALVRGQSPRKKQKTEDLKPIVYVRFNTRMGKAKPIVLKALLDSGASESLVLRKHAKKLRLKNLEGSKTLWTTPAGSLKTSTKCQAQFIIPEFYDDRMISWDLHTTDTLGAYDLILGRDVLRGLGINLDFSRNVIQWDKVEVPLKDALASSEETYSIFNRRRHDTSQEHPGCQV